MAPSPLQNERLEGLQSILKSLEVRRETECHSLIISIDFGTTYSGVGYVFSSQPDQHHVVTNWPGLVRGRVSPKVPTVMLYDGPSQFKWGFEVGRLASNKIEAFKLFLDPSLPKPLYVAATGVQKELNRLKKTAIDVTRDFLRSLYQWALTHIEDRHSKEYLEVVTVKFVVSLPAVWPELARRATLQAARDAGIDPIIQIKEPEAAARFTLQSAMGASAGLQIGDAVTVCDAGGGTVDLISYEIKKMKPLELIELASGTSCPAGSLMLNKKFEDHLKSVIDEEEFFPLRKTDGFTRAMMKFDEEIKPDYVSSNRKTYFVDFPGASLTDQQGLNLKSNRLTLTGDDLKRIFQPVVMEVNQAISAQILSARLNRQAKDRDKKASVKAIFLVGGLGANKHLREHVQEHQPGVKIIQPDKAWSAVIEGAILWHAPTINTTLVASRSVPAWYTARSIKAPRHYGIACSSIWDAEQHAGEAKYWDAWEGVWRCTTTTWCIKKGEDLSGKRRIALPFYKQCGPYPDEDDLSINATLKHSISENAPTMSTDASIVTNRAVQVSLHTLPHAIFHKETRRSDGKDYWEIFYELVLEIDNGSIWFWMEINDEQFGKRLVS